MEAGTSPAVTRAIVAALLAFAALLAMTWLASASASAAAAGCAHADDTSQTASREQLRRAVVCLVNEKRDARGKPGLDDDSKLEQAATKHAKTMKRKDCFSHKCSGEPSLGSRVRNTGYLQGADRWHYAENFGCSSTPQAIVNGWMHQDFSRKNILKSKFRDVGVGMQKGVPEPPCMGGPGQSTFVGVFAWRKP